jgi:biotin carboxyl carrier protein
MKEFNYKINGTPYKVFIRKSDASTVTLEVNGTPFIVEIESKEKKKVSTVKRPAVGHEVITPQSVTSAPLVIRPSAAAKVSVQAPLPGNILELKCQVGDEVKKGQTLLVIEAMKMENNIVANTNGKVVQILVNKGDVVPEGADLVIIE